MAQTKRKRRSKHRGNAAGTVESRGRTGRKPAAQAGTKRDAAAIRAERRYAQPTWSGAAVRAAFASLMLFALFAFGLAGNQQELPTSLGLCLVAFAIYLPLGYKVDRALWERRMRKAGRPLPVREKGKR